MGVVYEDSVKKTNPSKRLEVDHQHLGEYMKRIVRLWLRIRTFLQLDDFDVTVKIDGNVRATSGTNINVRVVGTNAA